MVPVHRVLPSAIFAAGAVLFNSSYKNTDNDQSTMMPPRSEGRWWRLGSVAARGVKGQLIGFLGRRKISQKIALGYGLSISIAVVGAVASITVGSVYGGRASLKREIAVQKAEWVYRLSSDISPVTLVYPQHLSLRMEDPNIVRYRVGQSRGALAGLRLSVDEFEAFILENRAERGLSQGESVIRPLRYFLDEYEVWIESVWWALPPVDASLTEVPAQLQRDRLLLLEAKINGEDGQYLATQLRRLSRQLSHLAVAAAEVEDQAIRELQTVDDFRVWFNIISLAGSALLAVVCAIAISRAIARPINQVTAQTHRVTREQDFNLRISVDSKNDEIAQLAGSIDQLVSWAGQYTHELQVAQNTLEQRVEERTQELRVAQSQIVQSEKMSSLGQMVAGVAHEINNPVGFIYSNVTHATEYVDDLLALMSLYRQELEAAGAGGPSSPIAEKEEEIDLPFLEEDIFKLLGSMKSGADRIKQIVLSLRTFSRLDEADLKDADLHQGLESTITLLEHRLRGSSSTANDIEVIRDYGDLPPVQCYAGQLNQVFMNLLTNAIDALEDGRKRSSHAGLHVVEPSAQRSPQITITTRTCGDRCTIAISDNGPGIPPETRARIFDPFFTTKPIGKGTGMGLAVSYQIVADRHDGKLTCTSSPGEGTTFTLEIPIALNLGSMDEPSLAS